MILNIGYWKHDWRPIFFTLFVNYFFVRYDREEHAKNLVTSLSKHYTISRDWEVKIYMGMTLEWGFKTYYIRVSIIDYIVEALIRFRHNAPQKSTISTASTHKIKLWRKIEICQRRQLFPSYWKR